MFSSLSLLITVSLYLLTVVDAAPSAPSKRQSDNGACQQLTTNCVNSVDKSLNNVFAIETCVLAATCFNGQRPVDNFLAFVFAAKNGNSATPPRSVNLPRVSSAVMNSISTNAHFISRQNFIDAFYRQLSVTNGPWPSSASVVINYFERVAIWTAFCAGDVPFRNFQDYFQYSATVSSPGCLPGPITSTLIPLPTTSSTSRSSPATTVSGSSSRAVPTTISTIVQPPFSQPATVTLSTVVPSGPVTFSTLVPSGPATASTVVPSGPATASTVVPSGPATASTVVPSGPATASTVVPSGPATTSAAEPSGTAITSTVVPTDPATTAPGTVTPSTIAPSSPPTSVPVSSSSVSPTGASSTFIPPPTSVPVSSSSVSPTVPSSTFIPPPTASPPTLSSDITCQQMFWTCGAQVNSDVTNLWSIKACVLGATCVDKPHTVGTFASAIHAWKSRGTPYTAPVNQPRVSTALFKASSTDAGKTWSQQNFIDAYYSQLSTTNGPFPPNADKIISYYKRVAAWTGFCGKAIPYLNFADYFQWAATVNGPATTC